MRKLLSILALLVGASLLLWGALPATDDFNRADGALGANWGGDTAWGIYSNRLSVPYDKTVTFWSADSFAQDHYSQGVLVTNTTGWEGAGPCVRCSGTSSGTGYVVWANNTTQLHLAKLVAGTYTEDLAAAATVTNGDTVYLSAVGSATTTVTVKVNGLTAITFVDSSSPITTGSPGMGAYYASSEVWDNWEGGDVAATGGVQRKVRISE